MDIFYSLQHFLFSVSSVIDVQSVLVSGELSFAAPLWVEVILKTAIMFYIMSFTWFHIFVCVTPSFQCGCICDGIVHKDIIMDFVSPLSCSMTSGKSGL